MTPENKEWYNKLNKSSLTPPNWVFGVVWPILYAMMGVSMFIYLKSNNYKIFSCAVLLFLVQLVLNLSWTRIFFKNKNTKLALFVLFLVIIFTILTYRSMRRINKNASMLLIPYILWLLFAFYLNFYIVLNNTNKKSTKIITIISVLVGVFIIMRFLSKSHVSSLDNMYKLNKSAKPNKMRKLKNGPKRTVCQQREHMKIVSPKVM